MASNLAGHSTQDSAIPSVELTPAEERLKTLQGIVLRGQAEELLRKLAREHLAVAEQLTNDVDDEETNDLHNTRIYSHYIATLLLCPERGLIFKNAFVHASELKDALMLQPSEHSDARDAATTSAKLTPAGKQLEELQGTVHHDPVEELLLNIANDHLVAAQQLADSAADDATDASILQVDNTLIYLQYLVFLLLHPHCDEKYDKASLEAGLLAEKLEGQSSELQTDIIPHTQKVPRAPELSHSISAYGDANSIIYCPNKQHRAGVPERDSTPTPSSPPHRIQSAISFIPSDAELLDEQLPSGGIILAAYSPDDAIAWISNNPTAYFSIQAILHQHDCDGPLPFLLNHSQSALAIFGDIPDHIVTSDIKQFAEASGFPIVLRRKVQSPLLALRRAEFEYVPPEKRAARLRGGGTNPAAAFTSLVNRVAAPRRRSSFQPSTEMPAAPSGHPIPQPAISVTSAFPNHKSTIDISIRIGEVMRTIHLLMDFSFAMPKEDNVAADITLAVRSLRHPDLVLDTSNSNMGFVVHRPHSIRNLDCELDAQYREPPVHITHTAQTSHAKTASFTATAPKPSTTFGYTHTTTTGDQKAAQGPAPPTTINTSAGLEWGLPNSEKAGMDFRCYDIHWEPAKDERGVPREAKVVFNLQLELHPNPTYRSGIPNDVGAIFRNQIMFWVNSKVHGSEEVGVCVMLVATSYIPKVLTTDKLNIHEGLNFLITNSDSPSLTHFPLNTMGGSGSGTEKTSTYLGIGKVPPAIPPSWLAKHFRKLTRKQPEPAFQDGKLYDVVMPDTEDVLQVQTWNDIIWPTLKDDLRRVASHRGGVCNWTRETIPIASATPSASHSVTASTATDTLGHLNTTTMSNVCTGITTPEASDIEAPEGLADG